MASSINETSTDKTALWSNSVSTEEISFDEATLKAKCNGFYNRVVKRVIDFVIALALLAIVFPIYLILSALVVIETGFPVFYRAERGGYKGETFRIFKFRSMVKDADKIGGGTTALNDSRITRVGAILRKTKLDETPQLLNILGGTMSFIGPRPELLQYTENYDSLEKYILGVRPGITDYSSIHFINLDEIVGSEDADEVYEKYVLKTKNALRLKYVQNISAKTDISLFFGTIFQVIKKVFRLVFKNSQRG